MKTNLRSLLLIFLSVALASVTYGGEKKPYTEKLADRMTTAEYVLELIMMNAETTIPREILRQAKGIIILNQYRGGLIFGGQGGTGVMVIRIPQTGQWGTPGFVTAGQASFGLQAGYTEVNNIYLLMSDDAVTRAYTGRFNVGVDAKAVAGPVGKNTENFDLFKAEVLVYSAASGLFAGATVKGGWVSVDDKANKAFYNTNYSSPEVLLSTWLRVPPPAQPLMARLRAFERE
ncbi:MAG: lipid-binding SYLF domain-containing protein [Opitutaceae bacterium]